ncbi:MAG: FAD-dependent oxidoreductase [Clostridiales bacterium]|nr:FAD-dependent oxidoreductase [Clostridiales bacterium]
MSNMKYQAELDIRYEKDVVVMGGGPAGCAAAWAAAKKGKKVLLVEMGACLGGMGTAALVPLFLGFTDGQRFLAGDFAKELLHRMHENGSSVYRENVGETGGGFVIHAESLKIAYEEMLLEAGVELLYMTRMVDVLSDNGMVQAVVLSGKSGVYAAKAKVYIDGTGDGDLAAWAGAPFDKGDETGGLMGGTLCSLWTNIDWSRREPGDNRKIDQAYQDGVLDSADYHLPGMFRLSDTVGIGNIGHTFGLDGTDDVSLSKSQVRGRDLLRQYTDYYRKYLPGFENAQLVSSGAFMGVRESRIIHGAAKLTLEDFINRQSFPDEIGRFSYQVDIHASNVTKEKYDLYFEEYNRYKYQPGESYGIPFGIIKPQGLHNVLMAGRCVSTDRHMQSSIRVMPGCMMTGQAAGFAAAWCVDNGGDTLDIPAEPVREELKKINVYLP